MRVHTRRHKDEDNEDRETLREYSYERWFVYCWLELTLKSDAIGECGWYNIHCFEQYNISLQLYKESCYIQTLPIALIILMS